ncbi:10567_t:CDS:2, partial [Acaulospora colombiana]
WTDHPTLPDWYAICASDLPSTESSYLPGSSDNEGRTAVLLYGEEYGTSRTGAQSTLSPNLYGIKPRTVHRPVFTELSLHSSYSEELP